MTSFRTTRAQAKAYALIATPPPFPSLKQTKPPPLNVRVGSVKSTLPSPSTSQFTQRKSPRIAAQTAVKPSTKVSMKRQRCAKFIAPRVYLGRKCKSLVKGSQAKGRGGSAEGDGSIFTKEQELEVNQGMMRALIVN
jgi:hypothetical protein